MDTHVEEGLCDPALLRLPDREGDRPGRGPRGRDRPRPGARSPSSSSKASRRRATSRLDIVFQRGVRERRLHDVLPRRRGSVARVTSGRSGMTTGRRAARRAALFVLYQWDVTGQPLASLYEGALDPYTQELAEGVAVRNAGARRDNRGGVERLAARAARRARAQHPSHRALRARPGRGAARGVDRRGGSPCATLFVGGRCQARERNPRQGRKGGETVSTQETPVGRPAAGAARSAGESPTTARGDRRRPRAREVDVLQSLAELAKEIQAEIDLARREGPA